MARANNHWFEFGGVSSVTNKLKLLELPDRPRAMLRAGDGTPVLGRDGLLWRTEDAYEEFEISLRCEMLSGASAEAISAWLTGRGALRFSDDPNRAYKARALAAMPRPYAGGSSARRFVEPVFSVAPCAFAYPIPTLALANGTPIINPGTRYAMPKITITGSGDATLTIGGKTINITGISTSIVLDVEAGVVYNGETGLSETAKVSGDWPLTIPTGSNAVSWTGGITAVSCVANWRCL